jgi:Erythromycin biosynthesis protein CIII-like, C-terminal domain
MSQRLPNGLAWTLLGLTVVLLAAAVVLGLTGGETWTAAFGFVPATLSFALVGALVAVRAGNRLGWLFLAGATVTALSVAAKAYAARTPGAELPGAAWAGWILTVSLGVTGTFFFLVPLLFPDGRPPSPRWRPVVWIAVIAGLAEAVSSAISDVNFSSDFPHLSDPVVLVAPLGTVYNQATTVGPLLFLAGAVSMIVRYRRSGQEQRQQLKWFVYAAAGPLARPGRRGAADAGVPDRDARPQPGPGRLRPGAAARPGGRARRGRPGPGVNGTVIKALAAGVPLVVAPLGRDQPDNAARVVYAGAGLRVSRKASVADLRQTLGRVLDEPRFRTAARRMAATLAAERDEGLVVDELERAALEHPAVSH